MSEVTLNDIEDIKTAPEAAGGHVHHAGCSHGQEAQVPYTNVLKSVGRNDPCHCKSGKKFKKCCLLNS
jgi:uncharacterized protein YecA (UPF0149 family)